MDCLFPFESHHGTGFCSLNRSCCIFCLLHSIRFFWFVFVSCAFFSVQDMLSFILEREREGEISIHPLPPGHAEHTVCTGIKPETQASALIRNGTHNLSVHRTTPNQLRHTGQGSSQFRRSCSPVYQGHTGLYFFLPRKPYFMDDLLYLLKY